MLKKGDNVAGLTFTDHQGNTHCLDDFKDRSAVILFFYPMDFSPGCTREACYFRDYYREIVDLGGVVFGVSTNSADSHAKFGEKHKLPYPLIPDTDRRLSKTFGTGRLGGWLGNKRVTFVLAPDGEVIDVIRSELDMRAHAQRVVEILTKLKEQGR